MAKKTKRTFIRHWTGSNPIWVIMIIPLLITLGWILWLTPWNELFTWTTQVVKKQQHVGSTIITPTLSPTPIQLHAGIGNYRVTHGKTKGPSISNIIFNPLDVHKNQTLSLSVTLRSDSQIKSVTGTLLTDTSKILLNFTRTSESMGIQTWTTEFNVADTLLYTYVVSITAINDTGQTFVTVAPRS